MTRSRAGRRDGLRSELEVLGALATVLCPDDLMRTLQQGVELLHVASGADEVALLLHPRGGTAPVLAARSGRLDVPPAGEVRVELPVGGDVLGQLRAAWASDAARVDAARTLIERAARPFATALRAGLAAIRDAAERALDGSGSHRERRHALLRALLQVAGAERVTLVLPAPSSPTALVDGELTREPGDGGEGDGGRPADASIAAVLAEPCSCPVLARGELRVLAGPRDSWPEPCRSIWQCSLGAYCLPLGARDGRCGAVIVDYGAAPPEPPTRDLVPLLDMARAIDPGRLGLSAPPERGLALRCLGPFELRVDGRIVPPSAFKRRKALALLQVLALARGRPVERDELIEQLWPGVSPRAGANRLHGVVHALRAVLEREAGNACRRWVRHDGDRYWLTGDEDAPLWIDVQAMRDAERRAAEAERRGLVEQAIDHLEEALALYRGDLLAGASDGPGDAERWCREGAELRERCVETALRLAELWVDRGEPGRAILCLRRGLEVDPLREDLHQRLIQVLADCGRREEARAQYRECVRLLRAGLDADPLPATQRLMRLLGERRADTV